MKLPIKNLSFIQSILKEKQIYLFYPDLKDNIFTGYFNIESSEIFFPFVGWIKENYCLSKYSFIGIINNKRKISFDHQILCCRLSFQVKALPKFTKINLTALIINKTIKNWGYEAYLESGFKSMLRKPPFSSKLWLKLQKNLKAYGLQQIKVFPLYTGWNQNFINSHYVFKKNLYLSLVLGLQESLIKKKKIKRFKKKKIIKIFNLTPIFSFSIQQNIKFNSYYCFNL
jgi:hypothetical protein